MTELQESRKAQLGDMSDILEKREALGREIQELGLGVWVCGFLGGFVGLLR